MENNQDVIVRDPERHRITGVPRGSWARLEKEDKAPKRIPLTDNGITVGWLKSELLAWVQERAARRTVASENGTEDQIAEVEDSDRPSHQSLIGKERATSASL